MVRDHDRQILLMALVVLGATGLAAVRIPGTAALADAMGGALAPVQRALTAGASSVSSVIVDARALDGLRAENRRLTDANAELVAEGTKLNDLIRENRALRDELDFARLRIDLDLTGASVAGAKIAEEPGSLRHTIKLDVGARDGVRAWLPVASHVGLIGQVMHVAPYWCDVMLVNDPASSVQARVARSRHTGIVSGTPSGELIMRYLPQDSGDGDAAVEVGDLIYTSGLSERFPPMLLIGQVTEVRQSDEQTHQEAVVRAAVDLATVELALVIRGWLPPTEGGDVDVAGDGASAGSGDATPAREP
jgi:rod shape-determining protein MreC